jgi:hypothetical protein
VIRRQREQDSIYRNGPPKIIRPNRNIILKPSPGPGGYTIYWWETDVNVSFSQSPGSKQPNTVWPLVDHNGPWIEFAPNQMMAIDGKNLTFQVNLLNVTASGSAQDKATGDSYYLEANAMLYFEAKDQNGYTMGQGAVYNCHATGTQGATGLAYAGMSGTSPLGTPSYPTWYRWIGRLAGNASLSLTGTLLIQAQVR